MAALVALFNFTQHLLDIGGRKFKLRSGSKRLEFLTYVAQGFFTPRGLKSLADPLGNGHPSGAGNPLDFAIFGVLQSDL
jgi:hypothetical protein